jgi:acetaldehyde dehydrogenase/alcohol dehydrogenase
MLWLRLPERVYFKRGCLKTALSKILKENEENRVFIVTDAYLYQSGAYQAVADIIEELGAKHTVFFEVAPDPTIAVAKEGARRMQAFSPTCILALGGGSPMDAAKIMWVLYEYPDTQFERLALRFMDIEKRVYEFPKMGKKAKFIAVPTTAGTGSEVTPFAVITDEKTGGKYPLADYELLPSVAICDVELMLDIPKNLTAIAGFDALSHAVEAVASVMSSDFTNGLAYEAICLLVKYLPLAFEHGRGDIEAREKVSNAATMAGIAFANAFLGLCHSMAHKLGAYWHLPHGVANALLLCEVMKFNAAENPLKMATFPQYAYPQALSRYAEIARRLQLKGETDEQLFQSLLDKIEDLKSILGLPKTIREAIGGKGNEEGFLNSLDRMSQDAFDDQCTGANPRYPLVEEIKQMYLRAYYGEKQEN